MIETYLQMSLALAAVVGVILLMGLFVKKRQSKAGMMNVLAYQSFGPRKGIAALKIGKEILLLGITSADIKLLKTFSENEFEAETFADMNKKIKMLRGIKERLNDNK